MLVMEIFHSHNTVTVEPQDEAMEAFRKQFKLVAGCQVSEDGKVMVYQMQTLAGAARWMGEAQRIITANLLPLKAGAREVKKDGVTVSVELRIIFQSK